MGRKSGRRSKEFSLLCIIFMLVTAGCGSDITGVAATDSATGAATFNVMSYGAKGDGQADDGIAIRKAMAAAATSGGGVVTIPCGEFAVKSLQGSAPFGRSLIYLKAISGVQVVGHGHCTHVFTNIPLVNVFEFDASTKVSFSQLRITAVNAISTVASFGNDGGSAIRFSGVANGSITNVEVDGAAIGALYLTANTSHTTVANNFVHDTYGSGIWEDDCSGLSAATCAPSEPPTYNTYQSNKLTNTALAANAAMALDDGSASSFAVVEGNTFSWTRAPLPGHAEVFCVQISNASDISVIGNTCSGAPWDGLLITSNPGTKSQRDVIQGNTITSAGSSGQGGSGICVYDTSLGDGTSGFVIAQNTVTNSAADGIEIVSAGAAGGAHDGQIVNNTIVMADQRTPGTSFGISVTNSKSMTVTGNGITCNGKCIAAGVRLASSSVVGETSTSNSVSNIMGPPLLIQ